jgi:hypothetical protein
MLLAKKTLVEKGVATDVTVGNRPEAESCRRVLTTQIGLWLYRSRCPLWLWHKDARRSFLVKLIGYDLLPVAIREEVYRTR